MPDTLDGNGKPPFKIEDNHELNEWVRCVYERAQETIHHGDDVLYEVAAVVWSANTLLLGFILEVPLVPGRQRLVIWAAAIGFFMTLYVPYVVRLAKKGAREAQTWTLEIEKYLPEWLRLYDRIDRIYKKRMGQYAMWFLTAIFVCIWLYVLLHAVSIVCSS